MFIIIMKVVSLVALVLSVVLAAAFTHVQANEEELFTVDPDAGVNVTTLIQRRGYAVEEHSVTTEDRYVLTMYRLPKTYEETQGNRTAAANKPAVYLIHGLLDSSFTFVNNYRNQSLAYLLADAGYDVWLGNNRGTTWSRTHLDFTASDSQYWDFSWEEMGKYDMPAMINYVLKTSGRPTISYIGHSEGTTQAFVGFSLDQSLAKKVSYFAALGSVAYVGGSTSLPFLALAKAYVDEWFKGFGQVEFGSRSTMFHDVISTYGCAFSLAPCDSVIQFVVGPATNLNTSRIHVYVSQTPAGTSVKTMAHYAQGIRDHTFRRYDYGCSCSRLLPLNLCSPLICPNKAVYGSFDPPSFDLSAVQFPRMSFFKGANDSLATPSDIAKLRAQLPVDTIVSETVIPEFNHLDYSWAYNARDKLYDELITQLQQYEGQGY